MAIAPTLHPSDLEQLDPASILTKIVMAMRGMPKKLGVGRRTPEEMDKLLQQQTAQLTPDAMQDSAMKSMMYLPNLATAGLVELGNPNANAMERALAGEYVEGREAWPEIDSTSIAKQFFGRELPGVALEFLPDLMAGKVAPTTGFPMAGLTRFDAGRKLLKMQHPKRHLTSNFNIVGGKPTTREAIDSIKRTYQNPRSGFGNIEDIKQVPDLGTAAGSYASPQSVPRSKTVRTPRGRLKGERAPMHFDAGVSEHANQYTDYLDRPSGRPMTMKELNAQAKPGIPRVTESRRLRDVPLEQAQRRSRISILESPSPARKQDIFAHEFGHELHLGLSDILAPAQQDVLNKSFRETFMRPALGKNSKSAVIKASRPHINNPRELFAYAYEDLDKYVTSGDPMWLEYPKEVRDLVQSVKATADLRPTQGFAAHAAREKQLLKGRKVRRTP